MPLLLPLLPELLPLEVPELLPLELAVPLPLELAVPLPLEFPVPLPLELPVPLPLELPVPLEFPEPLPLEFPDPLLLELSELPLLEVAVPLGLLWLLLPDPLEPLWVVLPDPLLLEPDCPLELEASVLLELPDPELLAVEPELLDPLPLPFPPVKSQAPLEHWKPAQQSSVVVQL